MFGVRTEENLVISVFVCLFLEKNQRKMLPQTWFSEPVFGHPAESTKLDRPQRKQFWIG